MSTSPESAKRPAAPVEPSDGSATRLRPAGPFTFDGGFWGRRQRLNSEVSLPLAMRQLEAEGQLADLRRVAEDQPGVQPGVQPGDRPGRHSGRPYSDSDVYKVAEALAWDGQAEPLASLAQLVRAAARPDGYLHTWSQCTGSAPFADLHANHEMYNAGHLIQAAVAEARALGTDGLLGPATRFADHLVRMYGPAGRPGVCGHPQIEIALIELYRLTGRDRYLALAKRMIDLRGTGLLGTGRFGAAYYQDRVPVRNADELDGHCVRAFYLATAACDAYLETGEQALLDALRRQWEHTVATKTYLTGGVGCRRRTEAFGAPYELPPDQAVSETCAGVASVLWSWRMLLATGEPRYADLIERVLYNTVATGVSLDGEAFSYVNPLHRRAAAMEIGDKAQHRKAWFHCACCPPNVMRLLASLGCYWATVDSDGVQLHQYASGTLSAGGLVLSVRTEYPWQGEVVVESLASTADERTVSLRVPAWCESATVTVDGVPLPRSPFGPGYLGVRRRWRVGERLVLDLAMPPRFTWPDERIDAVRGCVAVERGPLVYCVEDADLPPGVRVEHLRMDTGTAPSVGPALAQLGGALTITADTCRQPARASMEWPYRARPATPDRGSVVTVPFVPYHAWDNRGLGQMRVWLPAI